MLPIYPNFIPVSLDLREQAQNLILKAKTSITIFSFANLYLFRNKYNFKVALLENNLLITGTHKGKTFFSIPGKIPQKEILTELLRKYDYWRGISEEQVAKINTLLPSETINEDRDNFEYLYLRAELAELPGKSFQKKRNLVNAFIKTYSPQNIEKKILNKKNIKDALRVLDKWKQDKGAKGDYDSAKEALDFHEALGFSGLVFYVGSVPVGYCQGEALADGKSFAVHFEKAIDEYKGIYQYINQEFAKKIPEDITHINREQDLGDKGLRQAKMTYRPVDFVKLFSISASTKAG
ncbi:MAG: phosphatidylglycerol lysyltransferase domain-containing protein [Fibromonadaceae bacterium]|jgi:hypothetical protein|nr:phosphatidylglycerol lysyltransferase domain-containing protein [Fibromonadaceae bacterium]